MIRLWRTLLYWVNFREIENWFCQTDAEELEKFKQSDYYKYIEQYPRSCLKAVMGFLIMNWVGIIGSIGFLTNIVILPFMNEHILLMVFLETISVIGVVLSIFLLSLSISLARAYFLLSPFMVLDTRDRYILPAPTNSAKIIRPTSQLSDILATPVSNQYETMRRAIKAIVIIAIRTIFSGIPSKSFNRISNLIKNRIRR